MSRESDAWMRVVTLSLRIQGTDGSWSSINERQLDPLP
jgi:hypothetical protein